MPKPKDYWNAYKKRILIALGGVMALVAAVTGFDLDDKACQQFEFCKDAYDRGSDAVVSPTTV